MSSKVSAKNVRIGLIQMKCGDDLSANLDHALGLVETAAERGAQIVCLPELFRSKYFCQVEDQQLFDLAETIPGPSTERLSALAKKLGIVLIGSLFEKRTPGVYHNTAVVFDADGTMLGKYRKMHIPDDPQYYEKFYFTPGDLGFRSFETKFGKIGVLVCWDQWFPEGARITALTGAQILFYPTAIGWLSTEEPSYAMKQREAWETIQRSHAIANGVYVVAVNRVGKEGNLSFWGRSFVADPMGAVVGRSDDQEEVLIADCDLSQIEQMRRDWPFLRDRRIDAYQGLGQRMLVE